VELAGSSSSNVPFGAILGEADALAQRLIASAADLALLIDREGRIVDVWLGETFEGESGWDELVGMKWADTVLGDSAAKVEALLESGFDDEPTHSREINQAVDGIGEVPLRFNVLKLDDERVLAPARDIRPLAAMQQRLVTAQQAMDLEYRRLRRAGTAYRVLFRVCSDGAVIVREPERKVVEANTAAAKLLGVGADALRGQRLEDLFDSESRDELVALLGAVEAGASTEVSLVPASREDVELTVTASRFRQGGALHLLVRFWQKGLQRPVAERTARMMCVLDAMPDGIVVTDEDLNVLSANTSFCELVQRATEQTLVGHNLGEWIGRPGVDLKIVVANLREHGVLRDFSTVVRGEYGISQEALVTAVAALEGDVPCYGFTVRAVTARVVEPQVTTFLPSSAEKLRSLVGRVSLKEIVQESTDLIERLCIEAALDVSGNNRAAAAQLLGLSRQSLYSKLRRHGIGEYH